MLAYKNKSRLLLLYKWNKKLIKKEHVSDYLKEEGIKNIAVCGNGLNAYLFIKDCMINEINVKYILSDSSAKFIQIILTFLFIRLIKLNYQEII